MLASPWRPTASGNSLSRRREVAKDTDFHQRSIVLGDPPKPGHEARSERVQLKLLASCGDPTRTSWRYPCRSRRNLLARRRA